MPYLRCVNKEKAKYILKEIHEGICKDHAGPRSLISKVIQMGYFLAYLIEECKRVRQ